VFHVSRLKPYKESERSVLTEMSPAVHLHGMWRPSLHCLKWRASSVPSTYLRGRSTPRSSWSSGRICPWTRLAGGPTQSCKVARSWYMSSCVPMDMKR
jgi:hypothetical protein